MADIKIKVLMDDKCDLEGLEFEHGLSIWIEGFGKKILFDAGKSDKVFNNAEKLNLDLFAADALVISHGHYDHAGGVEKLLENDFKGEIYIHPSAGRIRYCKNSCGVRGVGISRDSFELIKYYDKKQQVIWSTLPVIIAPNISVTGQIPRVCDFEKHEDIFFYDMNCLDQDIIVDEQALVIETQKGLVVIFGCAHPGIINTLSYIERLFQQKRIYGIFGGLHLKKKSSEGLEKAISALKKYDVQIIGINHCTGERAQERLIDEFGEKVIDFTCGKQVEI